MIIVIRYYRPVIIEELNRNNILFLGDFPFNLCKTVDLIFPEIWIGNDYFLKFVRRFFCIMRSGALAPLVFEKKIGDWKA